MKLNTHQRLVGHPLRSLKPVGIIQELYALLIAHYALRYLMHRAALRAAIDPDRISFVHALEVVRDAIPEFQMTAPDLHPALFERLLCDLTRKPLPKRRLCLNPRVVKRKMSKFRGSNAQNTRSGLNRLCLSVSQSCLFEWSWS